MDSEFHLREVTTSLDAARPRVKPPPQSSAISAPFSYSPSDDGTDENLLILLHGLGDTHLPFSKLGRSFKLPQTATLALRAPKQIPYLYEQSFQWYPSFDALGDILAHPNPTMAIDYMMKLFDHLVNDCGWSAPRIHLFGFAQGGTVAAESALRWWQYGVQRQQKDGSPSAQPLGSVVTVGGPLLSYPTLPVVCTTPILVFHRPPPSEPHLSGDAFTAFRKGFSRVIDVKKSGQGMPRSKDEWYPIMELWSEQLERRQVEGIYEVTTEAT
ncbi:hypothetical protein B0F90DRAFT_1631368 [Multifurca ochricompacta]|uniref:Phospholipase/carboxylesterase/thioesterase domain-containing protein n=1 Tax=Multifurca ochricompacta TaxID=376703 RepID=A0AAD4QLL8_9AGAM|nr:hypothetical protein B0F90DRAFT_1631368 [Multifurca ochricompacta]